MTLISDKVSKAYLPYEQKNLVLDSYPQTSAGFADLLAKSKSKNVLTVFLFGSNLNFVSWNCSPVIDVNVQGSCANHLKRHYDNFQDKALA